MSEERYSVELTGEERNQLGALLRDQQGRGWQYWNDLSVRVLAAKPVQAAGAMERLEEWRTKERTVEEYTQASGDIRMRWGEVTVFLLPDAPGGKYVSVAALTLELAIDAALAAAKGE